ncbi:hypothetical protein BDV41DRAFT_464812 [Aspergillus transmontanensis]|uniref:Uncharacterized protein n=1 Tax=Aspergillus transmontanensis TaxID=1034304 RepID=A0A5N6VKQ8_9EURO|nr:hypothetical protein BDV41DRAFT_464812 [Aspergillus transmontanensis]
MATIPSTPIFRRTDEIFVVSFWGRWSLDPIGRHSRILLGSTVLISLVLISDLMISASERDMFWWSTLTAVCTDVLRRSERFFFLGFPGRLGLSDPRDY